VIARRRRVVVTGMGVINPMGHDVETVWQGVLGGKSGVARITLFNPTSFPTQIAAEVKDYDVDKVGESLDDWKFAGRHTRFAIGAAKQAVLSSGILDDPKLDPTRFGVYLGSGEGNQDFHNFTKMMVAALENGELDEKRLTQVALELINPYEELQQEPNVPAGQVARLFNAQGPNYNCLTACAASSQALGEAVEIIRRGDADAMISGGTHSMIHPFGLTGFNLLTALSTRNESPETASRPFDRTRDGFVLGEGSGMLVLEELEHAERRGANILGEIIGYGTTADAFRITDQHPEGRGAIGCMKLAMEDAGLNPDEIDYVNAHGTSTTVNDKVETLACKMALGEYAKKTPVSSTKSMMGHLIAAAGATEAIMCLLAIRDNVLPPTINYHEIDPRCDLDYVPNQPRETKVDTTLSNSFGFGGQNVTLAIQRV